MQHYVHLLKPIPPLPCLLSMATMPKKTRGCQKVELKRVENEDARYVTFSKRKMSLFKKATKVGTLCSAEIAFVVFSLAGWPYSLGLPIINDVFYRIFSSGPAQVGSQMVGHSMESPSTKQCFEATKNMEREERMGVILVERLQMSMDSGGKVGSMDSSGTSSHCKLKRWRSSSPRLIPGSTRSFSKGHHRR